MSIIPNKRYYTLFYYIVLNIFIAIQEITCPHTGLASHLQLVDLQQEVACSNIEYAFIDHNHTWTHAHILLCLGCLENLQIYSLSVRSEQ